jgi:two-component system phosphate regulon sensor histidine kinase PhoR
MKANESSGPGVLRSPLFWRLFGSYAAVLAATGLLIAWQVEGRLEASHLADLQATLEQECVLLAPFAAEALPAGDARGLQDELARMKAATDLRVTLILPDGRVCGDSHEDPAQMDDHSNRPEILQARTQSFGMERRHSHTLDIEMLYVARRVEGPAGPLGFVRLAVPVSQIDERSRLIARSVLWGTAAGGVVALALGLLLARQFTRPIAAMKRVAEDLSAGDYASRVRVGRRDELGLLGETLNELGAEITRRIAALSQEDAQLRAILASMIEGVVAVDEEARVAFINDAARALLEIAGPVPAGRALWDLAPIRELEELLAGVRRSGVHEVREIELFRGGKERVFQAHASPFQGGGRIGSVLVLHDITELRRLERIRRDFVANVSHELKTPLTSIQGFVETLLSGALQDERNNVKFLQRIEANVKRLTNLVSDLLSLARIESGQLDVQRGEVDWREVLDGVLRLREPALLTKGLALRVEGRERPLRVRGDREAMTQVLDNLVDNAIQYTSAPGRITVRLSTRNGHGLVAVEDTGMGIPSADIDRVFERFYRVDKARSRAAGGTGLGLSIVKNLVLRMEGEVQVASVEGKGSTFTVLLPLV